MSILSTAIASFKAGTPLLIVITTAGASVEASAANLIKAAESNPIVGPAVSALVAAGAGLAQVSASWVGTAVSNDLSSFESELDALVTKYGPKLLGAAASQVDNATLTALGAAEDVAVATVKAALIKVLDGIAAAV